MTQEDKELLLKDLCARLPYRVKVHTNIPEMDWESEELIECESDKILSTEDIEWFINNCGEFKPYLRPMSSITSEEIHEFQEILGSDIEVGYGFINILYSSVHTFSFIELQALFDWLNAHHFDYRGLIEKGLALEAQEGMYN